jgi:hypothetical protein
LDYLALPWNEVPSCRTGSPFDIFSAISFRNAIVCILTQGAPFDSQKKRASIQSAFYHVQKSFCVFETNRARVEAERVVGATVMNSSNICPQKLQMWLGFIDDTIFRTCSGMLSRRRFQSHFKKKVWLRLGIGFTFDHTTSWKS